MDRTLAFITLIAFLLIAGHATGYTFPAIPAGVLGLF